MDIQLKSIEAQLVPVESDESDTGPGQFHAIISSQKRDRDGDQLWADEWEQPLPDQIVINGDHDNNHIMSIIGSGTPTLESDNKVHVRGYYAGTKFGQDARTLATPVKLKDGTVVDPPLRTLSCAYREKKGQKGVTRELINASFVVVASNTDCVVLESKSHEPPKPSDMPGAPLSTKAFIDMTLKMLDDMTPEQRVQAIHDMAFELGSTCTVDAGKATKPEMITLPAGTKIYTKSEDGTYQEFSQAPEAPSKEADSSADQAKSEEALALAKAKAMAIQISLTDYEAEELLHD